MLLALLLIDSCSINVPTPGITDESIPQTEKEVTDILTGCYSNMMEADLWNGEADWTSTWFYTWVIDEVCSDDSYKGGNGPSDAQQLQDLSYFKGCYGYGIEYKWQKPWTGIYRCHKLLEGIEKVSMSSAELKSRYIAEAKFLRAFYYFNLVTSFGDVPIITKTIGLTDVNQPRRPVKEVYETIIEPDLKFAVDVLPQKDKYTSGDAGRITRGAALALLAKIYLYQQKYNEAFTTAQKVIDEGQYSLESDFRKIFDVDNVNGRESIFEIPYSGNQTFNFGWPGRRPLASRDDGSWGWMQPSTDLDREFETGDPRRLLTIIHDGDTHAEGWEGKPYPITAAENNQTPYTAPYKFFIPKSKRTADNKLKQNYNLQLIRYADLLLFYAEAALKTGNHERADWAVEQVRARARSMSATPAAVLPAKRNVTMNDIIHERRVELAQEGHRFKDLKRWGMAQQVLNALPARTATYPEAKYIADKGKLYSSPKNDTYMIPPYEVLRGGWKQNPPW